MAYIDHIFSYSQILDYSKFHDRVLPCGDYLLEYPIRLRVFLYTVIYQSLIMSLLLA